MRSIANRKHEFELFERSLHTNATKRILLFEGDSERGKSTLLAEFSQLATEMLGYPCCACTDLKGGLPLMSLFVRFSSELGAHCFPNFSRLTGGNSAAINITANLSGATMRDGNSVAIRPNITTGAHTIHHLSEALVQDLHGFAKPVVLIVDTFEQATPEVADWIQQNLLPAARHNQNLRIILAGKTVPLPNDYLVTWGRLAEHRVLNPITSIDDWHDFAKKLHPAFPRSDIELVCKGGLTNRPSVLHSFIQTIVQQLPPHETKEMSK